ncbi:hypothetical protein RB653_008471 [Dictyostelium firmibasis]|uniref:Uncharacterized protein n=1 Tax=Dictyostelium firmibasis TaxID=79012 RepID=A0AAN7U054_9MYCE
MEKVQKISDLLSAYQKVSSFRKVEKKLKNGKSTRIKKLFLIRGRYYYPAKVHRKGPSNVTLIKNTAMNTFENVSLATDEEIYFRMFHAKQREKFIKASSLIKSVMSMAGDSYKRALEKHGLTNGDVFQYNEEDDEDYVPSESDDDEDNSDTEDEEEQQQKQLQKDEDEEQFEEQDEEEEEEEEEVDEDEDGDDGEGFEMEDDFEF